MRIRELIPWRSRERQELSHSPGGDPFVSLQSQMHRLFDEFFEGFDLAPFGKSNLAEPGQLGMPKVDVAETDDAVQVTAELPGLKEQDLDVSLSDGHLVIRGEKKEGKEEKEKNYYRMERTFGSFHRSIPLPAEVDDQKVDASFKDGVLNVVLPKVAPSPARGSKKIPVKRLT